MQASATDHLAATAGIAPAAPDLPEGLGRTQCPHGYLEPVTAAEPPCPAPESPERWQSNSQLQMSLLELGCLYAHSNYWAAQAGGAHQVSLPETPHPCTSRAVVEQAPWHHDDA